MSEHFLPGHRVYVDRSVPAEFVRYTPDEKAVIRIGEDTRVVDPVVLTSEEG